MTRRTVAMIPESPKDAAVRWFVQRSAGPVAPSEAEAFEA